ncbi:hypothetical protein KAR34_09340 [bacterium]|nr:hypothetical protein [bacterium]
MKKKLYGFKVSTCYFAGWAGVGIALGMFILLALIYPNVLNEHDHMPGLFLGATVLLGYIGFSGMVYLRLGKIVSCALKKNGAKPILSTPVIWSNGMLGHEKAYRDLQKNKPGIIQQIRYFNQFDNSWEGMLAILPGVQRLNQVFFLHEFFKEPRPLKVRPQIQPYVWGKQTDESFILKFLNTQLHDSQKASQIAELWFGAHEKNPGRVGPKCRNMDLDEFSLIAGEVLLGTNRRKIGQLFKVLDAVEPLSIQMHERYKPDSKNECWMIIIDYKRLMAENKDQKIAELYLGFRPMEEIEGLRLPDFAYGYAGLSSEQDKNEYYQEHFGQALEKGITDTEGLEIKAYLNKYEVRWEAGQVELYLNEVKQSVAVKNKYGLTGNRLMINVPGATVHALAYGTIYELQETADKTLRLYDQGRNDPKRPLHIEEALGKLDYTPRKPLDYMVSPVSLDARTINLIRTPLYAMDEIQIQGSEEQALEYTVTMSQSYQMLVVAQSEGKNYLTYKKQKISLQQGNMYIIPVRVQSYALMTRGKLTILKAYEATSAEIAELQAKRGTYFWEKPGFFEA